jgi:hypothetical protein
MAKLQTPPLTPPLVGRGAAAAGALSAWYSLLFDGRGAAAHRFLLRFLLFGLFKVDSFIVSGRLSIDVHLAMTAIELQAEATAVAKLQTERLAPRRLLSAMLHAIAQ